MTSYRYGPHFPLTFDHSGESEIAQKVYEVLAKAWNYRPEALSSETKLWKDFRKGQTEGQADYVKGPVDYVIDVISEMETAIGVELFLDDFEKAETISDLIEHIEGKVGELVATS